MDGKEDVRTADIVGSAGPEGDAIGGAHPEGNTIKSFSCKLLVKDGDAFVISASPQMYRFFGTSEESYREGMLVRIRRDIGDKSADALTAMIEQKASKREDFRLTYPSQRADGSACEMQLDAYAGELQDGGCVYDVIEVDITELVDARRTAEKLAAEKVAVEDLERDYGQALIDTINKLPSVSVLYREDVDGNMIPERYSDEFCRLKGCTQDNIRTLNGRDGYAPVYPEDREALRKLVDGIQEDGRTRNAVYRILTFSGAYKWVSVNFVRFSIGDARYLYAVYADIDEVKKREEELEKQYETAQSFLESVADTYVATERVNLTQNRIEVIGGLDPYIRQEDCPAYDQSTAGLIDAMPRQEDRERCSRAISREFLTEAYAQGTRTVAVEYLFRPNGADGAWMKAKIDLSERPGSGDLIAFFAMSDISRAKTIETIMNDVLVKQYDFIICINAAKGTMDLISYNRDTAAIEDEFDATSYEQSFRNYLDAHMDEDQRAACIEFMRLDNVLKGLENDGHYSGSFTVEEYGATRYKRLDYRWADRELGVIVFIRSDYTVMQRQQMEYDETLRAALASAQQANAAKSEFLSRMSHEIRTPMNAIIGMDTLAAQAIGDDGKVADCIAKIGLSARYLLSLINDILDMSRIESGKVLLKSESFRFRDLIDGIDTMIYNQTKAKGIDYECIVSSEIDDAYIGDEMKLQQVLINVLGNAVKFTDKGKVSLAVSKTSRSGDTAMVRFVVTDTGIGIAEDHLEKIFLAFEQEDTSSTVYAGTGLGLAITKNFVELMGGHVNVRSIVGVGSEFTIDVPLRIDTSVPVRRRPPQSLLKMEALVVDDDTLVCEQAFAILKDIGMVCEWVTSGRDAVSRVKARMRKSSSYDFILIDWKMPGMDGIQTTREIRKIVGPDVTIIIISAYDWESIEAEATAAGANLFITKPLFKETLVSTLEKVQTQCGDEEVPKEDEYDFTGKRILLAEDNELNAEIARNLLENRHFEVDVAPNGLKATEMFAQHPVYYYDAILMDIRMPLVDGLQATTNIRHWDKEDATTIPIIAMTANAFDEDIEKSRAAGMNAHLSKPIEPQLMYRTLYRAIYREMPGDLTAPEI